MSYAIREVRACDAPAVREVARLLDAYVAWLQIDLCYQDYDAERADPTARYAPPKGGLWLAWREARAFALVALKPFDARRAELKRLFVEPDARGSGVARALSLEALGRAREAGFDEVLLDTLPPRMPEAVRLYERLGFQRCPAYYHNPVPGVVYYRHALRGAG